AGLRGMTGAAGLGGLWVGVAVVSTPVPLARGTGGEDWETRGAAAIVTTTPSAAATAQPNREAGLEGRRPSSSREMRETRRERRSARPATGTPRGDAWIHSATVAKHLARDTADPVFRMAHSSLRYSAVVSSSRRASRLS